jgi:hypothetical protein
MVEGLASEKEQRFISFSSSSSSTKQKNETARMLSNYGSMVAFACYRGVAKPMTKIALLNFFDANYTQVGAISAPNKLEYCMRHNYAYICERIPNDSGRPAAWHKLDMIRRHLPYFDWVFWNDADTLIMNMDKKLEDLLDLGVPIDSWLR